MLSKIIFVILLIFSVSTRSVHAQSDYFLKSAELAVDSNEYLFDSRVIKLKIYLKKHNSPLEKYAYNFIIEADKNDLDWRLMPAIAGVESTFGKRIPISSYNAYGWANGNHYFDSWEDSIEKVSFSLKEKYADDGLITVKQISKRYAPPSSDWAWKVEYFMKEIEYLPVGFDI